jgi:hypothetical protein
VSASSGILLIALLFAFLGLLTALLIRILDMADTDRKRANRILGLALLVVFFVQVVIDYIR